LKVVRCFQNIQNILVDVFSPGKRCAAVDLRGNSVTAWGWSSGVPRNFVRGDQKIQLRIEDTNRKGIWGL